MMYAFSIAIAAFFFGTLCVMNRRAAVIAFCALLPTYVLRLTLPVAGFGVPTTFLEIMFVELALVWLVADAWRKYAWAGLGRYGVPIAMFLSAAIVSTLVAPDLRAAVGLLRAYVLEPLLFFVIFVDVIRDERDRGHVVDALACTLAVIGVTAIVQKLTGYGIDNPFWAAEATRRATSLFGFPNAIGLFAAPVTVLCLGRSLALFERRRWLRSATLLACFALGWLAMLFAVSEGALVGALAGTVLLMLSQKRLRAAALALIIAGSALALAVPKVAHYLTDAVLLHDDSGSVRKIVWSDAWTMLKDHPVFGAGLGGYQHITSFYHTIPGIEVFMYPHTIVLNFWTELGLAGLLAFIIIVAKYCRSLAMTASEHKESLPAVALVCAMVALLVHGLVDVPYFKNDLAMLFWVLIGLSESMRLRPPKVTIVHALQDLFERGTLGRR